MKLTRRQEKFIQKMIELKHEFACPIHYSVLAKRLGVSPFTAYDMLCLLEEKGYVTSEYQLPADKSGPGRAERLFYLSEMAQAQHRQMVDQMGSNRLDEQAIQAYALEKLRKGQTPDPELTEQMMARLLPNAQGEMQYCIEVMTIAALRLKNSPGQFTLMQHLQELLPGEVSPGEKSPGDLSPSDSGARQAKLCLLGGFIYGLLAQYSSNPPEWLELLREHLQRYIDLVMELSAGDCSRLAEHLRGVFAAPAGPEGG
jgi:DNA-binding transcriptional regulator YhcF (GntR family)